MFTLGKKVTEFDLATQTALDKVERIKNLVNREIPKNLNPRNLPITTEKKSFEDYRNFFLKKLNRYADLEEEIIEPYYHIPASTDYHFLDFSTSSEKNRAKFQIVVNDGKYLLSYCYWPKSFYVGKTHYLFKGSMTCESGAFLDMGQRILCLSKEEIQKYYSLKEAKEEYKTFEDFYDKVQHKIDVDYSHHLCYSITDTEMLFEITGK